MPSDHDLHTVTRSLSGAGLDLARWRQLDIDAQLAQIRKLEPQAAYRLLIESSHLAKLVKKLPSQELYLMTAELGADDAMELIRQATPRQLELMLDLDCWRGDEHDPERGLEWLGRMIRLGEEKMLLLGRTLELEFWALLLGRHLRIVQGLEAFDPDLEPPSLDRLAGIYEVEYGDEQSAKILAPFLNTLFSQDTERYVAIMETIRGELPTTLEEDCYQFRNGRLLDLGIEDRASALSIYAPRSKERFLAEVQKAKRPVAEIDVPQAGLPVLLGAPTGLLAEVLSRDLEPAVRSGLILLLNRVLSADGVPLGEIDEVRKSMTGAFRYLNVALETLAPNDVEAACALFDTASLPELFQVGFGLTQELAQRGRKLKKCTPAVYLDGPYRAFLEGLCRKRPMLFEGVDRPDRAGERPFADASDLALAEEWLEMIALQCHLFSEVFPFTLLPPAEMVLENTVPEEPEELTLSEFFLTALSNRWLGREFAPSPIDAGELTNLHRLVAIEGVLSPEVRQEAIGYVENLHPGAGPFVRYCLELFEEEFCAVAPGELEPNFIGGLIVRLS